MIYKSRGLKRRRNTDKWEVTLAHKDPMAVEVFELVGTIYRYPTYNRTEPISTR